MDADYYDRSGAAYFEKTVGIDMAEFRTRFLQGLPPGGEILDAGCGSGRDARAFAELGYRVTAMDGSAAMAQLASAHLGAPVLHLGFDEISWHEAFDGIWCSACLLHLTDDELDRILPRFVAALRPGGRWYLSFKSGPVARLDEKGRLFNDFTTQALRDRLEPLKGIEILDIWETGSIRLGPSERWTNGIVRKVDLPC